MDNNNHKNHNTLNSFLNDYFNLFLVAILIIFFLLAYWLLLGPKYRATKEAIEMNIAEQEKIYLNEKKKLADLQTIVELYKKVTPSDMQKFNGVLPSDYVSERLFGELEEIINRGGWPIKSLEISRDLDQAKGAAAPANNENNNSTSTSAQALFMNKPKNIGRVYLNLSVGSMDYASLKSLLRLLENNLRLFDITSVDFSPTNQSVTIKLVTYYYQPLP